MYHIIFDSSIYPTKFNNLVISGYTNAQKQAFVETNLIQKIKDENKKIDTLDIKYMNIQSCFPNVVTINSVGLIVEELVVSNAILPILQNQKCYVAFTNSPTTSVVYKIKFYVFLSDTNEDTRSAFVSQILFPEIIDMTDKYMNSPTFYFTNHPIYFVNMVNKKITAPVLLRELALLYNAGIRYIELFNHNSLITNNIPISINSFLLKYYNVVNNVVIEDDFEIDIPNKILKLKTTKLDPTAQGTSKYVKNNGNSWTFNGSSEKFYWKNTMMFVIFLLNNNFKIDYYDLENYLVNNTTKFNNSVKIKRFNFLLNYLKKITK